MRYILVRMFQGIFILFGVSLITFFLPSLYQTPLSLAISVVGTGKGISLSDYQKWIVSHGLNQPIIVQYWHWLWGVLHGNFGIAYKESSQFHTVTVNELLGASLWRSVWLVAPPTIAAVLVAIPIGLTQAVRRNKLYDHSMTTVVFVLYSTPAVLVCLLLQYYFAVSLHIGQNIVATNAQEVSGVNFPSFVIHNFSSFVLPYLAIFALTIGGLTRYMRGSALDTLVQDYIRTAKAKGASPTRVLFRHVLRPSTIPLITIVGLTIPVIIGGALIVEYVFNFPGIGLQTVTSVETGDFTVVMAITLFTAFLTVLGNLFADVCTAIADPRVRLTAAR
jgi:peptide/nickel transport system permease protein